MQSYYSAVEQQDYTTAYTYIDSSQFYTSTGQPVTLARPLYTLTARGTDLAEGKLTAYSIASISITNGTATVTVNATRGGTVRTVIVELQQVNGTWEIDKIGQS